MPPPREKPGKYTIVVRHTGVKQSRQIRVQTLAEKQDWLRAIYTRELPSDRESDVSESESASESASVSESADGSEALSSATDGNLKALIARRDALLTRAAKLEAETAGQERSAQTLELLGALELQAQVSGCLLS